MLSNSKFIEIDLKLKVKEFLSEVGSPIKRKFLGFSFYQKKKEVGLRIHSKSLQRLKSKVKKFISMSNAMSMEQRIVKLNQIITGWVSYFGVAGIN